MQPSCFALHDDSSSVDVGIYFEVTRGMNPRSCLKILYSIGSEGVERSKIVSGLKVSVLWVKSSITISKLMIHGSFHKPYLMDLRFERSYRLTVTGCVSVFYMRFVFILMVRFLPKDWLELYWVCGSDIGGGIQDCEFNGDDDFSTGKIYLSIPMI